MASIAKLAIQITTDTTRMVAGLSKAQEQVKGFATGTKTAGESLGALFAGGGAIGAGIAAATKAIQVLENGFRFAVQEGAKLQDRMAEVGLIAKDETFNAVWKEFAETIGAAALPAVRLLASALKEVTAIVNEFTGASDIVRQVEAAEKKAEAMKKAAEVQKKAAEDEARLQKQLMDEGARLKESLATPAEKMQAEIANLQRLFQAAAIDQETVRRGAAAIAHEYKDAGDKAKKFKELTKVDNAAVEKGTTAEFTARQDAIFAVKAQAEAQKANTAELKRIAALQQKELEAAERIEKAILSQPQLSRGRF